MNVLISGGAGYVGAHVALAFLDEGHSVTVIDSNSNSVISKGEIEFFDTDLRNGDSTNSVLRKRCFDIVVHCAALTSLPLSLSDPLGFFSNNVTGTLNLLAALKGNGPFRFIFSSTAAVYAPSPKGFVSENSLVAPITPYGESKRQCEEILRYLSDASDIDIVVLRYFNVAGADSKLRAGPNIAQGSALFPSLCKAIVAEEEFVINGDSHKTTDGTAVRDYIHVEDLARVHCELATREKPSDGTYRIYNVGYGIGHSVADVVATAARIFEAPTKPRIGPKRPGDLPIVVANTKKLFELLGPLSSAGRLSAMLSSTASWISRFNGLPPASLAY